MGALRLRRIQGITRRWLVNSLAITASLVVVAVTVYTLLVSNSYYGAIRSSLETRARLYIDYLDIYSNESYEKFYTGALQWTHLDFTDGDKLELQFIGTSGRVEITSSGLAMAYYRPQTTDVPESLETGEMSVFSGEDPLTGERVFSVSAPLKFGGSQIIGVLRLVSSMREADRAVAQSFGLAVLVGLAALVFIATINMVFIRGIVQPIQEINRVTKRIAAGSYGVRIEKTFDDEIGELADNINHMSSEINISNKLRIDFMSSVSHELRTPLTAISGWGETLLSADFNNPAELKRGIRIMLKEAGRLTRLVEELLDFTRMEGGRMTLFSEKMDVTSELDEVVYMMADALSRDGIEVVYEVEEDLPDIIGDKARLKQVFFNILDNAAKHGRDGKRIEIKVASEESAAHGYVVRITIRDFGAGIPAEELPHVKMRFYKGSARTRGNGIGLAVSDEIMRLHNGSLDIESTAGEGTLVSIRLPAEKKREA
ncbi:MAG: HAMP domain-containing histidine kinase [Oscillospiraceae bacterium]|jgi:signal transduction histidine kinase|nr:HAMP domain-containing histidine kinase [Oscillospiraceae bacterium]